MFDDNVASEPHDLPWVMARGGDLARLLPSVDLDALDDEGLLDAIVAWARFVSYGEAGLYAALGRFVERRSTGPDGEFAVDEIAAALRLSRPAAQARLDIATALRSRLPETADALADGRVDGVRARSVVELTEVLSPDAAGEVERRVLPRAADQTNQQLRAALRRAAITADPAAADKRAALARENRRVAYVPADDGMGTVLATLPAAEARTIFTTVDQLAWRTKRAGDERMIDALRADTLVDLVRAGAERLTGTCDCGSGVGSGGGSGGGTANRRQGPLAQVQIVVPAATLAGLSDAPGELLGHGPISAATARELAADGTWRRILTDPASGALLDYGTTVHNPPSRLSQHVRARDRTCRFPGCRQPAARCDLDHTERFPTGATAHDNLGLLCRRHHRLKHQGGWQLRQPRAGEFTWVSPLNRTYTVRPPDIDGTAFDDPRPAASAATAADPPDNPPDDEGPPKASDILSPVA